MDGEIDIIEGINQNQQNHMNVITRQGCNMPFGTDKGVEHRDCNNRDCAIDAGNSSSYGTGFNDVGGGVYAMELTSKSIKIWFFTRVGIANDIQIGSPDPTSWGAPLANWTADDQCDINQSFKNLSIIFDITFCGTSR